MTGSAVSVTGGNLGSVSVMGEIDNCAFQLQDGSGVPSGHLGSLYAGGNMRNTRAEAGSLGYVTVMGDLEDSEISLNDGTGGLQGWLDSVYAAGEIYNTTVEAGGLGSIVAGGEISEDEGTFDRIHVAGGGFYAMDAQHGGHWIPAGGEYWFDEGSPNGVRAWSDS
jgi:hypothetical protein